MAAARSESDVTSNCTGTNTNSHHLSKGVSAFTAPSKADSGAFVHGTRHENLRGILREGLKAANSKIFMINELRPDGRVPGLKDKPEVLIFLDEDKARSMGMEFHYDSTEGSWWTTGEKGVIRPWFFQRVVDQRSSSRGNVLFQSKDDPAMKKSMDNPPRRVLHATYFENLHTILRDGILPAKNPKSDLRQTFADTLRGAEDHIYAIEPRAARSHSPVGGMVRDGRCYALEVPGLDRPADALITIDMHRARELGAEIVRSVEREDTVFIRGSVPPEAILGIEANVPLDLPPHLLARIVDPKCFEDIPVIDVSADESIVIEQLRYACEVVGFMQIVGHGVDEDLFNRMLTAQKALFDLPVDKKKLLATTIRSPVRGYFSKGGENLDSVLAENVDVGVPKQTVSDSKEGFDCNGVSWSQPPGGTFIQDMFNCNAGDPSDEDVPGFSQTMLEYQMAIFQLCRRLLRLMALVMDLPGDFFEPHLTHPTATHRLLHYWPIKDFSKEIGVGAHTDYGLLTVLRQDFVGGLQVLNASEMCWVHAVPLHGALVVNIGDMLARWTKNRFKSTVHRVVNISTDERYSSPFFLEPNLDSIIRPGELCEGPGGLSTDEVLTAGTILDRFYTAAGMLREEHRAAWSAQQGAI
eukprot:TRINITY_DN56437_c0_g1_i1.p1 TRINITY_DN56437_c0_g1~~TRINITY_DN56437_c0_g1_i1.p1  ORF type:complete len:657 (+),score=115.67 TRINITY_DN56437_c0_g1_i1:56-1972(+)